jgi:hypothetical protein
MNYFRQARKALVTLSTEISYLLSKLCVILGRRSQHEGQSKPKAEDIGPCRDRYKLISIHGEGDGGRLHKNVGRELPERLTVPLIYGCEASVWLAIEDQASCGSQNAAPGFGARGPGLRNLPRNLPRFDVEGAQEALPFLIGVAGFVTDALFQSQKVIQAGLRGKSSGIPVCGIAGTTAGILHHRPAIRSNA